MFFSTGSPEPLIGKSPNPERPAITVSESKDAFSKVSNAETIETTGRQLLYSLGTRYEIIIVYDDGGDLLTLEQLQWLRNLLP